MVLGIVREHWSGAVYEVEELTPGDAYLLEVMVCPTGHADTDRNCLLVELWQANGKFLSSQAELIDEWAPLSGHEAAPVQIEEPSLDGLFSKIVYSCSRISPDEHVCPSSLCVDHLELSPGTTREMAVRALERYLRGEGGVTRVRDEDNFPSEADRLDSLDFAEGVPAAPAPGPAWTVTRARDQWAAILAKLIDRQFRVKASDSMADRERAIAKLVESVPRAE